MNMYFFHILSESLALGSLYS